MTDALPAADPLCRIEGGNLGAPAGLGWLDGSVNEPEETAEYAASSESSQDVPSPWPEPEGVIDATLFQLTMNVVSHMDALAAAHLSQEGYKWVPNRSTYSVTTRKDVGWPTVGPKVKDEETVSHGELFAAKASSIQPFQYDQIPAMNALEEYVRASETLLDRLHDELEEQIGTGTEFAEMMVQHRIHSLPASIYDRAMALGLAVDDPAVGDLYLERERSWLAPELPYEYVIPLVVTHIDVDHSAGLVIDDRTRVVRLTEDELRRMTQPYETASVPSNLANAAWWALVIDMPPLKNPGEGRRLYVADPVDTEVIEAACDALRVVSNVKTGWARVFRRPLGWATIWHHALPNLQHLYTARRYPAEFDDRAWLKESRPITAEEAALVPAAAKALKEAKPQTLLAMRRLSLALVRDAPDDQLIDACIGLEALLGQVDAELSYRIALRASALLATKATEPRNPPAVFKMTRAVYNRRSELVHGSTKDKNSVFRNEGGKTFSMNFVATFLLREVLHERLLRPDWTVEDLDRQVLTALEPNAPEEPPAEDKPEGGAVSPAAGTD